MPKLAALSNRLIRGGKKLTTYTFPAGTSTWTAPAGVTKLSSIIGKGSDGVAGYWYSGGFGGYMQVYPSSIPGDSGTTDWSNYYSTIYGDYIANLSAGSGPKQTGQHQILVIIGNNSQIDSTGYNINSYYNPGYWTKGTPTFSAYASSGTITYDQAQSYPSISCHSGYSYSSGYSDITYGFGKAFPGGSYYDNEASGNDGTASPATITGYSNVTVSPGTQYSINNYGSLTITYYA